MSDTTLFDIAERRVLRPKRNGEATFSYLNESARPAMAEFRRMADEWFARFPSEAKADLRGRFRSSIEEQHQAAFFELYVHELLLCLGYELQVHPELIGKNTHPDFLVSRAGNQFYVEVTLAGVPSHEEKTEAARIAQVYDCINKLESPNFFLHVRDHGAPQTSPEVGMLRQELAAWLRDLDPDKIAALYEAKQYDQVPKYRWSYENWEVIFEPIPKSAEYRGKLGVRPIGMHGAECEWLNTHGEIREAVEKKSKKYGKLPLPLIVAVNVLSLHCNGTDIMNGLFGHETLVVTEMADGSLESQPGRREPNGLWRGPRGLQNLTVSGVLVVSNLCPWNMRILTPELYHNPWALNPIRASDWELPQWVPDAKKERVSPHAGKSAETILSIPSPWPVPDREDVG